MRARRTRQRGFTLVELMVVIAIIAILSMLAMSTDKGDGPTASNASEQISSVMGFARLRASATRRIHRVQVQPNLVSVYQSPNTGLVLPTSGWQLIQETSINARLKIWNAQAGALASGGANPAESTSLNYLIDFKPDGRATASTIFVTNAGNTSKYRVLVYGATGGSYARENW